MLSSPHDALPEKYWIGGSLCSGKRSIARLLAAEGSFRLYSCDDHSAAGDARRSATAARADALGLRVLTVDGSRSIAGNAEEAARHIGLRK